MRYWFLSLVGVVVCSAAATAIAWSTWALTRLSVCAPGDDRLACDLGAGGLALVIGSAVLVAIPLGSGISRYRTAPRSGPLGPFAFGLAVTAGGVAALVSGITAGYEQTSATSAGIGTGTVLLIVGPLLLLGGLAAALSGARSVPAPPAAAASPSRPAGTATRAPDSTTAAVGTLAAQLAQIAAARRRTDADPLAAKLRQLDDLRASGLLSADEHAAKRAELLHEL
jgi:Short C-terminal domain